MSLRFPELRLRDALSIILEPSRMELLRLFMVVFLLRRHLGVVYEYPPWFSRVIWEEVRGMVNDGSATIYQEGGFTTIRLTDTGRRRLWELVFRLGEGSFVKVGPALVMRLGDLRARLRELAMAYLNTPLTTLASVAIADAANEAHYLGDRSIMPKVLWEASRVLDRGCEGALG